MHMYTLIMIKIKEKICMAAPSPHRNTDFHAWFHNHNINSDFEKYIYGDVASRQIIYICSPT